MAEWTGQKRTLNSIPTEDDPPLDDTSVHVPRAPQAPAATTSPHPPEDDPPLDDTSVHVPRTPQAPAATSSPQLPGMTPDQPALPGRSRGSLPPLASNRRPLTEYGSAQRLLGLFTPAPGTELQASDWEQGPSVHGRAAQGRPGAADADPAPRRRWPWHRPLDVRHRHRRLSRRLATPRKRRPRRRPPGKRPRRLVPGRHS